MQTHERADNGDIDPQMDAAMDAAFDAYFDDCHARIPQFVAKNFGIIGTLKIHRHALGRDLIYAPLNVLLSIGLFFAQIGEWGFDKLGQHKIATWLRGLNFLLPTNTSRYVQTLILRDLFLLSPKEGDFEQLQAVFDGAPELHEQLHQDAFQQHVRGRLKDYASTRVATSEMTSALGTIGIGAAGFHSFTPGLLSVVPLVAAALTNRLAASQFIFGERAGTLWYQFFPKSASMPTIIATALGLMLLSSLIVTFAGLITDPIQKWTGFHEKRLNRLVDSFEAELKNRDSRFPMRELFLARIFDISDGATGIARIWF